MHPFTLFPDLADFIRAMPKAELHVHLEGAIQPHTLLALARQHNAVDLLPAQDVDGLRRWFRFTDFPHFVEIYVTIAHLLRTPDDFALIVREAGAAMAAQNIRYSELTVTPYTHTHSLDKGLTIDDIVAGIEAGRRQARAEHGVEMRWVFDIARETGFRDPARFTPDAAEATLDYALANREHGVIGLGLGGYEVGAPPEPFAEFFAAAQAGGLHSLPHAGETVGPARACGARSRRWGPSASATACAPSKSRRCCLCCANGKFRSNFAPPATSVCTSTAASPSTLSPTSTAWVCS